MDVSRIEGVVSDALHWAEDALSHPAAASTFDADSVAALVTSRSALVGACERVDGTTDAVLHVRAVALAVVQTYHQHFQSFTVQMDCLPSIHADVAALKRALLPSPSEVHAVSAFLTATSELVGDGGAGDVSSSSGAGANSAVAAALAAAVRYSRLWDVAHWHAGCEVYKPNTAVVRTAGFAVWLQPPTGPPLAFHARVCLLTDAILVRQRLRCESSLPTSYCSPSTTTVAHLPPSLPLGGCSVSASDRTVTLTTPAHGNVHFLCGAGSVAAGEWEALLKQCATSATASAPRKPISSRAVMGVLPREASGASPAVVYCGTLMELMRECLDPAVATASVARELLSGLLLVLPPLIGPATISDALVKLCTDGSMPAEGVLAFVQTWAAADYGGEDLSTPGVATAVLSVVSDLPGHEAAVESIHAAVRAAVDAEFDVMSEEPRARVGSAFSRQSKRASVTQTMSKAELWSIDHVLATATEFAYHLAVLDRRGRAKVHSRQLLAFAQASVDARELMLADGNPHQAAAKCCGFANTVFAWVCVEVLQRPLDTLGRTRMVSKFLGIAAQCRALHNYNALFAITGALSSSYLSGLDTMWAYLSDADKALFDSLRASCSPDSNYRSYRLMLQSLPEGAAVLSVMGVDVEDMTKAHTGDHSVLLDEAVTSFSDDLVLPSVYMVQLAKIINTFRCVGRRPFAGVLDLDLLQNLTRCLTRAPSAMKLERLAASVKEREHAVLQDSLEQGGFL